MKRPLIPAKRPGKQERERKVLLGLVEHYIRTGKPVGSTTLKETEFSDLSSATIRNYFAHLEEEGYLTQAHSSGGRIPTARSYRLYADAASECSPDRVVASPDFSSLHLRDSHQMARFLQDAGEALGQAVQCAVFLSAPRFDQDVVIDLKLVPVDSSRCLCIVLTQFGGVHTEVLHTGSKLSNLSAKRIESYFHSRLTGVRSHDYLEPQEEELGKYLYNEVMLRCLVKHSSFLDEDLYRTGFSHLLNYPEFQEVSVLADSLALFENTAHMRRLLKESKGLNRLKYWIGDALYPYTTRGDCTVIALPYYLNTTPVGAIGVLGPMRLPYRIVIALLRLFAAHVTLHLTRAIYKFKITLRQPLPEQLTSSLSDPIPARRHPPILLENKP